MLPDEQHWDEGEAERREVAAVEAQRWNCEFLWLGSLEGYTGKFYTRLARLWFGFSCFGLELNHRKFLALLDSSSKDSNVLGDLHIIKQTLCHNGTIVVIAEDICSNQNHWISCLYRIRPQYEASQEQRQTTAGNNLTVSNKRWFVWNYPSVFSWTELSNIFYFWRFVQWL